MDQIHDIRPPVEVGLDPMVVQALLWGLVIFYSGGADFCLGEKDGNASNQRKMS